MLLKITDTTNGRFIGKIISVDADIIQLDHDTEVSDFTVMYVGENKYRIFNSNYVIEAEDNYA